MANDKPGADVANFLKASGDDIVRVYLHGKDNKKCVDEIIHNSKCTEIFDAHHLQDANHVEDIKKLNADFIITVYWAHLLHPSVFRAARDTINFHPAFLPINRGWYPHVHSIIDGSKLGVTLHRIDEGADTGPIWAQKEVELHPYDSAKIIYEKLQNEIVALFANNWSKIKSGALEPFNQDESHANYHAKKEINELDALRIDENIKVKDLINILRARSFGNLGFAYYFDQGQKVYLNLRLSKNKNFEADCL